VNGPQGFRNPGVFLFFWVAVIALVVWLVVRFTRPKSSSPVQNLQLPPAAQPDPVLETLRRRLAAGEITVQEFDELRQKLGV
jgi:uncharacterized membrane protein